MQNYEPCDAPSIARVSLGALLAELADVVGEVEASIQSPPCSPASPANTEPKASSALEAAPVAVTEGEASIQRPDPELAEDEAVPALNGVEALERIDAELLLVLEVEGRGMPGILLDA